MNPYKYDMENLRAVLEDLREASPKDKSFLDVLCENTVKRIRARHLAYLEYGPYWFAVKRVLNENGYDFGANTNPYMDAQYTIQHENESAELTVLAGWLCADQNRDTYFSGTRDFSLGEDGEEFSLFDSDMEQRQTL